LPLCCPSVAAVAHGSADVRAREADIVQHAIVHGPQLPHVAADAQLVGNRGSDPRHKPGHDVGNALRRHRRSGGRAQAATQIDELFGR
jgi:hypothetical protein